MAKRTVEEISSDLAQHINPATGGVDDYISAMLMLTATLYSMMPGRRPSNEVIRQVAMAGATGMADALNAIAKGEPLPDYAAMAEDHVAQFKNRN